MNLLLRAVGQAGFLLVMLGVPAIAGVDFERHEIATGSAKRQTVVTGFLLGGVVAELSVVRIEDNGDRRVRLHTFGRDTWQPGLEATLRPAVTLVDVANIGGRDRLITYEPGCLNWFDPGSATERMLVAVSCSFNPPRRDEVPHVDVTRDVNGDGRDDLVVPDLGGFWVFIQLGDGRFAEPLKIGPTPELGGIYGADGYRYDPWSRSRVHEVDYNRDGRNDLVFWNRDHFAVHLQDKRGLFARAPETFTTEVAFDSDDVSSLATGTMTGRALHSVTDLNGDGVADLVVFALKGRNLPRKRSTFEVHFGRPAPTGGTAFEPRVDAWFRADGRVHLAMDRHDLDRDGRAELKFTTIEVRFLEGSLWKLPQGFHGRRHRRRAGAGPVCPAVAAGGGPPAQRCGIHLAGGSQPGRQAGHPHASSVHVAGCSRGSDPAAGN